MAKHGTKGRPMTGYGTPAFQKTAPEHIPGTGETNRGDGHGSDRQAKVNRPKRVDPDAKWPGNVTGPFSKTFE